MVRSPFCVSSRADECFHVLGFFYFVKGPGKTSAMLEALRRRDYERFATGCNGAGLR